MENVKLAEIIALVTAILGLATGVTTLIIVM
jgi:hypothetical protein